MMNREDFPAPREGVIITHFLVVRDQDSSREWYQSVFGAEVVNGRDPVMLKFHNSWLILNVGGGPTDDKPDVTLEPPGDPSRTSAFLNLRVADIQQVYVELERAWGGVSNPAGRPGRGDPMLPARPRWAPHRGRAGYRHPRGPPRRGLDTATTSEAPQAASTKGGRRSRAPTHSNLTAKGRRLRA